jgi:ABC-2 type transport system permease protein
LLAAHVRAGTLELLRYPAFSLPTLLFPTLLLVLFSGRIGADANTVIAGLAATALLAVAFFQFGVGIAAERSSPWEAYLRTLPATTGVRLGARVVSALLFAAASATVVLLTAVALTPVDLSAGRWLLLALVLLVGSVPFALLGIALGYWMRPRAALPLANLVFVPLSFAGGLWGGPRHLPESVDTLSPYLPTRQWAELLWASVGAAEWDGGAVLGLAAYGALFAVVAALGYRRDEGERYR